MPVHFRYGRAAESDHRVKDIDVEVRQLRREVESLRQQVGTENTGGGHLLGWATVGLAALGVLLGLIALFRH
jgi:hypothetical protein